MAKENIYRTQARAQGLARFRTEIPCRRGHVCERYTRDGRCVECVAQRTAIRVKRWAAKNPDKKRAHTEKWRAAHPDKWRESNKRSKTKNQKKYTDRQRADYALNPEKYRTVERKRRAQMLGSVGTHTAADIAAILRVSGASLRLVPRGPEASKEAR